MKFTRIVNIYLVPALVVIAGIALALRRRRAAVRLSGKAQSPAAVTADGAKERSDDV
jgi:NaMN:DMB phosphoribosyltransferase